MFKGRWTLWVGLGCFTLFSAAALCAQVEQPTIFKLQAGSTLTDGCDFCKRAIIDQPLEGTFVLTPGISIPERPGYEVSSLQLSSGDNYKVFGQGSYARGILNDISQSMDLKVEINGQPTFLLESGNVEISVEFPLIDITLTETVHHDPNHVFTLHLVAAPEGSKSVLYTLAKGAALVDDCLPPCARPARLIALVGTFVLTEQGTDPGRITTYSVSEIHFKSPGGELAGEILGEGVYTLGGEFAFLESMNVTANIDGKKVGFQSPSTPPGAAFPDLDVSLEQTNPDGVQVYHLHIVATPGGDPLPGNRKFRRGDANSDANIDISDAVFILLWRFVGGDAPLCLDTADTNADQAHDLTDAVFLLNHLFQGGNRPPEPGPDQCGISARTPSVGCDSYPPCDGA